MAVGGTTRTVYSEQTMKKASVSAIVKAISDSNTEAKKADPKNGKKVKK